MLSSTPGRNGQAIEIEAHLQKMGSQDDCRRPEHAGALNGQNPGCAGYDCSFLIGFEGGRELKSKDFSWSSSEDVAIMGSAQTFPPALYQPQLFTLLLFGSFAK